MSAPLRIGIIGTGFGASVHLPAFQQTVGTIVTGIASRDPEKVRVIAADNPQLRVFEKWQDLASSPEIDAIVVATPPATHADMCLEIFRNGKHVLCEKPFAVSVKEAERMYAASETSDVVAMVNFEFRLHPAFARLKEAVDRGYMGALSSVAIRWTSGSWGDPLRPWTWQCDKSQCGGILGALGVHMFDYIEWLLGPLESVAAECGVRIGSRPDANGVMREVTAYDHCALRFETKGKVAVSCELSNVDTHDLGQRITLVGDRLSIGIGNSSVRDYVRGFSFWREEQGGGKKEEEIPFGDPEQDGRIALMKLMADRFSGAVSLGAAVSPSFREGLRTQRILDAIEKSVYSGGRVDIPSA